MKQIRAGMFIAFIFMMGSPAFAQTSPKKIIIDSAGLSGEWWLQPALPSDTATGHTPYIMFNLEQKTFKGFTGCNQMSGNFHVSANVIAFDRNISLTRVACEGYNEKEFVANLLRVNGYQISDGVLTLTINKNPISKWTRKTAKTLVMNRPLPRH